MILGDLQEITEDQEDQEDREDMEGLVEDLVEDTEGLAEGLVEDTDTDLEGTEALVVVVVVVEAEAARAVERDGRWTYGTAMTVTPNDPSRTSRKCPTTKSPCRRTSSTLASTAATGGGPRSEDTWSQSAQCC